VTTRTAQLADLLVLFVVTPPEAAASGVLHVLADPAEEPPPLRSSLLIAGSCASLERSQDLVHRITSRTAHITYSAAF